MSSVWHRVSCVIVLLLCAAVVRASPVVGTETPICPTISPAPGGHDCVQIAGGSDGYLAVWEDTRGTDTDIFGCRISPTGEILDPQGIQICAVVDSQLDPAVSWNGTDYLVVWADRRDSLQHIYYTKVRPNGEVMDPQGICISGTNGAQAYPRVASDGSGWEVVWQDSRGGSQDIYGCRVAGDGSLGRVMGIATISGNSEEMPDIAYNGSSFVVVWRDQRNSAATGADIYGCRVAKNGLRLGSDIFISCDSTGTNGIAGAQTNPRISATTTSNCMVAWEDYRTTSNYGDIYITRVDASGKVLDKGGKPVATGTATQELPSIGCDGSKMLVTWRDRTYRYIRGARVSSTGTVLDSSGFNVSLSAASSNGTSVCGSPSSGFWVGWSDLAVSANNALTAFVPTSGSFAGSYGTVVSLAQDNQSHYSVADNGTEYAVVWSQVINGNSCIMAARVSYDGALLTPAAVNLTAGITGQQTEPSVAWNGTEYLVVWTGDETYSTSGLDIRGLRLDSTLKAKDTSALPIYTGDQDQRMANVTSNGSKFFVVWEDYRNAPSTGGYTDIYGAIVDTNGTSTPMTSAVNQSASNQKNPHASSSGTDFYVVWEDYRSGRSQAYGVKVSSSGAVASATGTLMPATNATQTSPNICYGGGYYLVTWSDGTRISGCRVSPTGTVMDTGGLSIDSGTATKEHPCAWWDGTQYQTVWEDFRSQFANNSDIYYTTVGPDGVISAEPRSALVSDLIPQLRPRIFGSSASGVLFYSRYENFSNGICSLPLTQQGLQEMQSIRDAKQKPTGSLLLLRSRVVTAVFQGYFYIEELDRSNGIKVVSSVTVHVGDIVDVSGVVGTCDAERQITTGSVTAMGVAGSPTMPFGMRGDMLGGVGVGSVTGITGASGANNIGLLVKTWGSVSSSGSGYFFIMPKPGTYVKVKSGTLSVPAVGSFVAVTGISTCEVSYGSVNRAIMPRDQSDIQVID